MAWDWGGYKKLSAYLQKSVSEMSNEQREAGDVTMDFSKFSEAQL
jgi:hypothetical protein